MKTRRRNLPGGWYPESSIEVVRLLEQWGVRPSRSAKPVMARAAIAPHAGWTFSGRLAARAVFSLAPAETVVVIGGHMPASFPVVAAEEDAFETPMGNLVRDAELAKALGSRLRLESDTVADNTVEVQLPLVKAHLPDALFLWLRAPAGPAAIELGTKLAEAARSIDRKVVCLASTDLTHYGPDYDFEPAGRGSEAEEWVRNVSDRGFIEAALAMDGKAVLDRGNEGSACSSGAAAAAITFAKAMKAEKAELLGYATSLEIRRASSFVGYCAIAYS